MLFESVVSKRDGPNHLLHSEHNLSDKREQQNIVAIFVSFAVFTVLALIIFYLIEKKGFCKRIQNQEIQMHEIVEPLNSEQ